MGIPVNPAWEYSVHQITKSEATTRASDVHPVSARSCLNFWRRTVCMVKKVCSSLSCSVPPPYLKHWTLLMWPGLREVDAAGEKAKTSWNDLVGLGGLSAWEFKGSFTSIVLQQGPIKVKHKVPVRFTGIKIIPTLSAWKCLNSEMMTLVRNPEECTTVNDSHAPSKWSHAVKQCILIAWLTSHRAASSAFPKECSKVLIWWLRGFELWACFKVHQMYWIKCKYMTKGNVLMHQKGLFCAGQHK